MASIDEAGAAKSVMIYSSRSKKEYVPDHDFCVPGDDVGVIAPAVSAANTLYLNNLLGQIQANGGKLRLIDKYMIDASLLTFDGLHVLGDYWETGLICDPRATPFSAIICDNIEGVHLEKFMMDGLVDQRVATDAAYGAIFLQHGVQNSAVENIFLRRFGQNSSTGSGNYVTLQCNQAAVRDTRANEINHLTVEDAGTGAFAVRLFTDFDNDTPTADYQRFVEDNTLFDLKASGSTWSCVEIAGPGTVRNTLDTATVKGCFGPSGFDVDKGASYNTMKNLHVVDAVPNRNTNFAGFFDQGFITQQSGNLDRTARGNSWESLFVIGGTQESSNSFSSFNINNSHGASVKGLTVVAPAATGDASRLYGVQTFDSVDLTVDTLKSEDLYVGCLINQGVEDFKFLNSTVRNMPSGASAVRVTNDVDNLRVDKLVAQGGSNGLQVAGTGTVVRGSVTNSEFKGQSYSAINCQANSRLFRGQISGNKYDATLSVPVRVDDATTFSYSGNFHGDVEHTLP